MLAISDLRKIVRRRRRGETAASIAMDFGVTRERICEISRMNLSLLYTRPLRIHSPDFIVRARRLWDEGHSASEVARRMNVTKNVIIGIADRNDFPARPSPIRRAA
jgi:DNA-directed RNA polymerase sigma subunit (sigma70/sigma32)